MNASQKKSADRTELVWVTPELAKKIKGLDEAKMIEDEIVKHFEEVKGFLHGQVESMDEDILQFKGYMVSARKKFSEAKQEQLIATEQLWENHEAELADVRRKSQVLIDALAPIKKELKEIRELQQEVYRFDIKRVIEQIEAINYAGPGVFDMLKFLMNNYDKRQATQPTHAGETAAQV